MMKRLIIALLVSALLLSFTACGQNKTVKQDDSPITIYVGLGNGQAYFDELKTEIKGHLGIDVQFVYQAAADTTNAVAFEFKNNDLPADIVCTSSVTNPEWVANSCLDIMSYTHLADFFTYQKIKEYTNEDGTIYQLPFTSKLIGITYNKTLMEENGFELPENFNDMLKLKEECDKRGILFSVSANTLTGHGFNYLFHIMGADWLSTLDGSNWLNGFLSGKEGIAPFSEKAVYFDKWVKNGLFGNVYYQDRNSSVEYSSKRALFFFDITNVVYSYHGEMVDENGEGTGTILHDEYAMMPWISENGSNNCFTYYDNMFMALNKHLAEPDQKYRLEKAVQILEFMTTEAATNIFINEYPDGYIAVNTFKIDESRLYYSYADIIEKGYIMPWYYSYFNADTIVNTGAVINSYMRGESGSYDEIIEALETNTNNYLHSEKDVLTTFSSDLSYKETAQLNAIGAAISLQECYDASGIDEKVGAALISYVNSVEDHQPFTPVGTISTRAYKGEFENVYVDTVISSKAKNVVGIKMTGKQIKNLVSEGLVDGSSVYPYALYSTGEIKDGETYVVAVSKSSLSEALLSEFTTGNAIVSLDGEAVTAPIKNGIVKFLSGKDTVSPNDLKN